MDVAWPQFSEPLVLWLLLGLVPLVILLCRRALRRRRGARQLERRTLPLRQRLSVGGDLTFWLLVTLAMAAIVVALARPTTVARVTSSAGADVIVLLDGSASMRVSDVAPDRWRRAVRWIRVFAETLPWRQDRVALGLFAHNAAPQLRLTRDPNALFFFLDHLGDEPPFRLDIDTTWDTNLEAGLYWGMRVLAKNEELYGPSSNGKAFVVLTDGQTWSGDVSRSLQTTVAADVPTYVIGVGSVDGGLIPEPEWSYGVVPAWAQGPPVYSVLDRLSLQEIALTGRGRYFELDRESDRAIALRIIEEVRASSVAARQEQMVEAYWYCLVVAAAALAVALFAARDRVQLGGHVVALIVALIVLTFAVV
jgi:Ca-activated chloride channel family protein